MLPSGDLPHVPAAMISQVPSLNLVASQPPTRFRSFYAILGLRRTTLKALLSVVFVAATCIGNGTFQEDGVGHETLSWEHAYSRCGTRQQREVNVNRAHQAQQGTAWATVVYDCRMRTAPGYRTCV